MKNFLRGGRPMQDPVASTTRFASFSIIMFVILGSIMEASLAFTYNSVGIKLQHKFVRSCANMSRLHASNAKDDDRSNDKEVTVSFKTADKTEEISINKGEILRSAMLKRGKSPHNGRARLINCRGTSQEQAYMQCHFFRAVIHIHSI